MQASYVFLKVMPSFGKKQITYIYSIAISCRHCPVLIMYSLVASNKNPIQNYLSKKGIS